MTRPPASGSRRPAGFLMMLADSMLGEDAVPEFKSSFWHREGSGGSSSSVSCISRGGLWDWSCFWSSKAWAGSFLEWWSSKVWTGCSSSFSIPSPCSLPPKSLTTTSSSSSAPLLDVCFSCKLIGMFNQIIFLLGQYLGLQLLL